MGKISVEICLISGRGLRRRSSFFRLQWYAVAWIDPDNKFCTRIDASGDANPVWKTKFSALVDKSEAGFHDLQLNVEVYSREPLFLRERLLGTATVVLKEFLDKFIKSSDAAVPVEEVGSFQLRKKNSSKPQGFVDVSIRVSEEREETSFYAGNGEGFKLLDYGNGINQPHQSHFPPAWLRPPENRPPENSVYARPASHPAAYPNSSAGPSYQPPRPPPPPPPPPSNVGYIPSFLPRNSYYPSNYINMPSSAAAAGRSGGPGGPAIGMGMGAGALAGGAVIFGGEDFMSGFNIPSGFHDPSLTVAIDPPF